MQYSTRHFFRHQQYGKFGRFGRGRHWKLRFWWNRWRMDQARQRRALIGSGTGGNKTKICDTQF